MPSLKFRYSVYRDISVPIIPVHLEGDGWHEVWTYVDSGASYSILKVQEADRLGIGFNILGRKDFFDRFVFCFDDYHRELSLTEIEKV